MFLFRRVTAAVLYLSKDIIILFHYNVQLNRLRAQKNIESACYHNILIQQSVTLLQSLNYKLRISFLLTNSGPSLIITDGVAVVTIHLS